MQTLKLDKVALSILSDGVGRIDYGDTHIEAARETLRDTVEAAYARAAAGEDDAPWLEVSAVRFGDGFAETCNDDPLSAHGFGVYMRNPLALHLIDFTPASVNPDKRVTLRECHLAAFRYAGALAEHMGADVRTTLNAGPLSYPSRFDIEPQRDYNLDFPGTEGTAFGLAGDNDATQWAVFELNVGKDGFPVHGSADLVEDYPSREAAQAAIDALERGEPLPAPVWPPLRRYMIEGSNDGSMFSESIEARSDEEAERLAVRRLCEAWGHGWTPHVELSDLGDAASVTPFCAEDYARDIAADMLQLLRDAVPHIAAEVEQRKESGNAEYFADLEAIEERMIALIAKGTAPKGAL